nr:hypothetical protein [Tanacetum cinerariifolium]
AKNINREGQIYAKVDGKKVIISEATIRRDLKFKDEGGVDYLSNEVVFEQLPLMRFVQVFLDKQVDRMSKHNAIYVIPSHTKKVFSNMKRVGKDFLGRDTHLFPTMIVKAQEELGEDTETPTHTQHTPTINQPTTSQLQRKQKPKKTKRKDTELPQTSMPTEVVVDEAVYEEMYDSVEKAASTTTGLDAEHDRGIISKTQFTTTLNELSFIGTSSGSGPRRQETIMDAAAQTRSERVSKFSNDPPLSRVNILKSGKDRLQLKELMELCTKLSERVLNLETTKTTQAKKISSLNRRVKRLEKKKKSITHGLKRLYKVGLSSRVESFTEEQSLDEKDASKHRRNIADIDADAELLWLMKLVEGSKIRAEESSKRAGEDLQQESTKKQKVDDDQEAAELKRCLDIVLDDVTIATPLSSKSPTIIDYKIYKEGRKTYYLLVEKMYPLTNYTLTQMWNDVRLQVNYEIEMAYDLLRLVRRQLKEGYVPE